MESVAVAFIFCFLFKTFEAEAFVIPTGSMAPTLYGRHKDVDVPRVRVGVGRRGQHGGRRRRDTCTSAGTPPCPSPPTPCGRRSARTAPARSTWTPLPPFAGDRILVNKWPLLIGDPDRWDVTVFKFPENPTTNYVKRLVGLPGETDHHPPGGRLRPRPGERGGGDLCARNPPSSGR